MNKLLFLISFVIFGVSSKPTNFEKFSRKISNDIEVKYVNPTLDESINYFAPHQTCTNFVKSLIEMKLKMHNGANDLFFMQKNFAEFLYLHEVGDRFFRSIIDKDRYPVIDIIAYFANLFHGFFGKGVCFGEETIVFDDYGLERLIGSYYDVQHLYYKTLQDRFSRYNGVDDALFRDLDICAPSNSIISLFDVIKYNTYGNKDLDSIVANNNPAVGFSNAQKKQILDALKKDLNDKAKNDVPVINKIFYHYSELAAAITLIQKLIRNFEYDEVCIDYFRILVNYIDHNSKNVNLAEEIDYLLSISFQNEQDISRNIATIASSEVRNRMDFGL